MAGAQEEDETETGKNKGGEQQQQQINPEKSSTSSFLWRGLRLGKRFAIAGAAIVAVPAVIPTIVFGVAFAFPFGVYMAGFALTDRVMQSLLSTSSSEIGILEDGKEKGGVLKREARAEEGVEDERDESTPLTAEQKIDVRPPATNLNTLTEEGDDVGATGIGKEKHAEEKDEPPPLTAEQKIDMGSRTTNLNILTEEEDDGGGTGIGDERHAEERDEPVPLTAQQKIDMWSPTTNLNILTKKEDDFGGTGSVDERDAEEGDEPAILTAEQKIAMSSPATSLNILSVEGFDSGGTGIGEERHAEKRDEPTPFTTEQKIDMWPPTTYSSIIIEEGDDFGGSGIGQKRHAEERDGPTPLTAEEKIDMWSPTTNLNILTAKGDDLGGTGIGEESHAEGLTDGELEICDPGQETEIKFKHTSSIDDKEYIIGDTGMKKEVQQMQPEREVEEKEERRERENDKHNTNEELKIWSSETSSNGNDYVERRFVNMKGGDKPFEVIGKGEKKKTKDEMEIQGLADVPEVKQYHMASYPSIEAMPIGTNNETDQCSAPIEKRNRTRIEEVQQPEMFLERRSGGTVDMVQDAKEVRVNKKDGIEPIQSSYVLKSDVEPSPEENRYEEGVETIGLTAASRMAKEQVLSANYTEDGISDPVPKVEDSSICPSFVSAAPLECENQMAPLNMSKEYASPMRDHPSDVTDFESGSAHTVVETAGVLHFNDEVPNGQDEVEREKHPLVQNDVDMSPLTINRNMPSEEGKNMGGMQISEERCIEVLKGRELYNSDAEQDNKMKFEFASSIGNDDVTTYHGMVQKESEIHAESGPEKSEHRDEMEKMDDEKAEVSEEQKIGSLDNSSNHNVHMHRGHANAEGADIVIELSGNDPLDKKKAEEEVEIQGLTAAVPEARCHPKTTPFAAVMPDNETEQRVLSSTTSSVAEKGNESRLQEVKQSETTLDGRAGRIKDEVHDLPPAAAETMELFPTIHYSLDVVPEEREIDFELPGMSSGNACSAVTNKEEDKAVKEANEEVVVGQEGMEPKQRNYVTASVVSVKCKSAVEQFAVGQNLNDQNAEDGGSDVTYNIEEASVHHPFVAAIPLESESEMAPSSLSTEFASAVEDQSSCMTDAESGPSVTVVETAGMVHFHDEASYSEESIWEQIYALRTIVGHKATLHSSLVEELKALYLVTGVEPPISLNDTSDILEISDKLKFLKSVVGVE